MLVCKMTKFMFIYFFKVQQLCRLDLVVRVSFAITGLLRVSNLAIKVKETLYYTL
jgi:hypothetical protein